MSQPMPIIVLAGSDAPHRGSLADVPPGEQLEGPKGTVLLRNGRCLAAELIERIRASRCFGEPLLLGPSAWYEGQVDCELVPVEGTLIQTLQRLSQTVHDRLRPQQPFAVTACDILPSPSDLQQLVEQEYAPHASSLFWWQLIAAEPDEMGASAWKPAYRLPAEAGGEPLTLYPGHLVIARAGCLRFSLVNRLLELAYRYRNRVLEKRYIGITLGALGTLLAHDFRNLARLQLPVLTITIPYLGLRGYFRYRRGTAAVRHVEQFLARAFVHRRFHRAGGGRPVVISISNRLAFAKDIDTRAELEELDPGEGTPG